MGVALGIAVFVAIQIANHSVLASFQSSLDSVSGKATLQISGGNNGLPDETYVRLRKRADPRIKALAPVLSRAFYSPTLKTSLLVLGLDIFAEADFRDFDLQTREDSDARSTPRARDGLNFLTDSKAIVIGDDMAKRSRLRIGDTLELFVGARREKFRIAAILKGEALQQTFGGDFAVLDLANAQESFGQLGRLSRIDLRVDDADVPEVIKTLHATIPPDAIVQRPSQRGAEVADMLAAFRLNLTALSCIAIFVGAFLIYNAIASAVVRRRAEVGVLRSVGASQKQLSTMFLIEAAFIGFLGSLAGLLLGIILARFALQAVSTTVSSLYVAVKARELLIPLWLVWTAPLGGTLLAVVAAIPPAFEAAATSPRAASLDATLHQSTARWALPLAGAGAAFLIFAVVLSSPGIASRSALLGFLAAFCTLGGFALATPFLTLLFARLMQKIAGRFLGIESTLASAQLQRALNRSSLVVAALMVALSMTIGLAVMVGSFRNSVADWVKTSITGDLYVATATGFSGDPGPGLPPEVVRYASQLQSVKLFDSIRGADTVINNQPVFIAANDLPALESGDRVMKFVETANGEEAARRAHRDATGILISERFKNLLGYRAGQTLKLQTPRGEKPFFIAGVFYDYTPNDAVIYLPRKLYRKYWNDDAIDGLSLHLKPGYSALQVKREFEQKFGAQYQLTLLPNAEIRESVFKTFDQTFAVTYVLQLIAVLIAAVGIFDTIWSLLLERTRELAVLRAIGASRKQIARAILIECALIGVCGWLIGMAAGLALAWQLIFVINRQFFGWTIGWVLPGSVPVQALILALGAAVGAGILPALQIARRSLALSLQRE